VCMITSNTADVGACDAQVIELTIVESGKLTHCLLVCCPFLEGFANVHLKSPLLTNWKIGHFFKIEQMEIDQRSYAFCAGHRLCPFIVHSGLRQACGRRRAVRRPRNMVSEK